MAYLYCREAGKQNIFLLGPGGRVRGHARSWSCMITQSFCPLAILETIGQILSLGAHHEDPVLTLRFLIEVSFLGGISCF